MSVHPQIASILSSHLKSSPRRAIRRHLVERLAKPLPMLMELPLSFGVSITESGNRTRLRPKRPEGIELTIVPNHGIHHPLSRSDEEVRQDLMSRWG